MINVGANQFKSCHTQSNSIPGCSASHLPFIGMNAKWLDSTFNVFCTVSIIPMHWPSEVVAALGKEELNLAIERSFIFWTVNSERLMYKEFKKRQWPFAALVCTLHEYQPIVQFTSQVKRFTALQGSQLYFIFNNDDDMKSITMTTITTASRTVSQMCKNIHKYKQTD